MKVTGRGSEAGHTLSSLQVLFVALALALGGLTVGASAASAFTLGVGWTGEPGLIESEMVEVGQSGAENFRLPMPPTNNNDGVVEAAARNGVTILAEVSPGGALPTGSARTGFINSVSSEVQRYGYGGQFWMEHAGLPYRPITTWEVYNEPNNNNIAPVEYGVFLNEVAAAIQSASQTAGGRGTEVLSGGLLVWGNRGGTKGNWQERGPVTYQGARKYLEEAYPYFGGPGTGVTAVAIHPYEIEPASFLSGYSRIQAFEYAVSGFRSWLSAEPSPMHLTVTEAGWPAEGQYSVGTTEQASLLKQAVAYSKSHGVNEFSWYNLRDAGSGESWQEHCGLIARNGSLRPSWSAFQELTGGPKTTSGDGHPVSMRDPVTNNFWIYYRGSEGYMRELYRNPTSGEWANNKVPAIEAAAPGSSPIVGRNATSNAQWIYYRGADGYVWELYRNPTSGEWANNKVPALEAEAPGTTPTMLGDPTIGQAWIYYQGVDGNIWELYRNPSSGEWANNKVPAIERAAPSTTPAIGRNATSNAMWIYYEGVDGNIWELYRNPTSGEWANNKVPAIEASAPGSSPTLLGDPSVGQAWMYYRGADGYLWELYRNPTSGEWANNKVPALESAAAGTTPVFGRNATSNAQWIYYQGADGYIWELFRNPTSGEWANTKIPNAQAAAPGTSPTMLGDPSTGQAWIEYWGSDGYMWELWRNPSTGVWANGQFPTAHR